jgi:hypothetical protein
MKKRFCFFLKHLAVSVFFGAVLVFFVFFVWNPSPLNRVTGVADIFFLLLFVDVVVGPLLGAVVYKERKREFYRDILVVVLAQIVFFVYGVQSIAEGRPAWIVYNAGRFDLVQKYQIDTRYLADAGPAYREAPWFGAKWVSVRAPRDARERDQWLFDAVGKGVDIPRRPELFQDLHASESGFWTAALPLEDLYKFNSASSIKTVLDRYLSADGFLPLMGRNGALTVLVDKKEKRILAVVDLNPWL